MPLVSQTPVRVRYADTDQMGVAHHAAHIVWLETGRTDFCRAAGFSSDGKLISEGETLHIPVDRGGKACAVPEKYYALLAKALEE